MTPMSEIYRRIKEAGLDIDEFERKVEEKVEEFEGLISKEGAAYIVAREMGVDLEEDYEKERKMRISEIRDEGESVTIEGRIIHIQGPREFSYKNGRKGRVVSVYLLDKTGEIRLTLWNEQEKNLEGLRVGDCIKLSRARVRRGLGGSLELYYSWDTKLERTECKEVPEYRPTRSKIVEIYEGKRPEVVLFNVIEKVRENTYIIGDETGIIPLVSIFDLEVGKSYLARNLYVVRNKFGQIELHLGKYSELEDYGSKIDVPSRTKISDLLPGVMASVAGIVENKTGIRETEIDGVKRRVADITLRDETGVMRVTFWDESVRDWEKIDIGKSVKLNAIYTKLGLGGEIEASYTEYSSLSSFDVRTPPVGFLKIREIREILPPIVNLRARVIQKGEEEERFGVRRTHLILGDDTGRISSYFWRDKSEFARGIEIGDLLSITDAYIQKRGERIYLNVGPNSGVEVNPPGAEIIEVQFDGVLEVISNPVTTEEEMTCRVGARFGGNVLELVAEREEMDKILMLRRGDVIRVKGGRIVGRGKILVSKETEVLKGVDEKKRREIASLEEGEIAEVRGTVVKVKLPVCEKCGSTVYGKKCRECGNDIEKFFFSLVLDDGTGVVRAFGFEEELLSSIGPNDILGKEIIASGTLTRNEMTGNLEMRVNSLSIPDLDREIKLLLEELEGG